MAFQLQVAKQGNNLLPNMGFHSLFWEKWMAMTEKPNISTGKRRGLVW